MGVMGARGAGSRALARKMDFVCAGRGGTGANRAEEAQPGQQHQDRIPQGTIRSLQGPPAQLELTHRAGLGLPMGCNKQSPKNSYFQQKPWHSFSSLENHRVIKAAKDL